VCIGMLWIPTQANVCSIPALVVSTAVELVHLCLHVGSVCCSQGPCAHSGRVGSTIDRILQGVRVFFWRSCSLPS
jgi:hypothetical protein